MPWRSQTKPTTTSIIRFYLDGATEPAIEGNMFEWSQGTGLIPVTVHKYSYFSRNAATQSALGCVPSCFGGRGGDQPCKRRFAETESNRSMFRPR